MFEAFGLLALLLVLGCASKADPRVAKPSHDLGPIPIDWPTEEPQVEETPPAAAAQPPVPAPSTPEPPVVFRSVPANARVTDPPPAETAPEQSPIPEPPATVPEVAPPVEVPVEVPTEPDAAPMPAPEIAPPAPAVDLAAIRSAYASQVRDRIERHKQFPAQAKRLRRTGRAAVSFTINADGSIAGLVIAESSGTSALDDAALQAVRDAAPFPAVPAALGIQLAFTTGISFTLE